MMRFAAAWAGGVLLLVVATAAAAGGKAAPSPAVSAVSPADAAARGQYLVRAGNCVACHTARGGQPFAGGNAIATPFGTFHAPNITPDRATGIGDWTADDFWTALHDGRSRDGSPLYPVFPYVNYTKVTRADADAMFAYLRALPPVRNANRAHDLRFPYDQRALLNVWRTLFFRAGEFRPEPRRSAEWNRGAYLVTGLGHCGACHAARNALGATRESDELAGGLMPVTNWYAPPLTSERHAGIATWDPRHLADLLRTGVSARGAVAGPMAGVVRESLQYLTEADVGAMVVYLQSLRAAELPGDRQLRDLHARGAAVYQKHCESCHQVSGEGAVPAYPPLSGNVAVTDDVPANAIRLVLIGGFPPATQTNPRPYGMPPFGHVLDDQDVAAVVTYIRRSWGNQASAVTPAEVARARGIPRD